jgi:hypothetical protein
MDVTGRTENDPAATQLVGNMLRYVKDWKAEPRRKVAYFGAIMDGQKTLRKTGALFVTTPNDILPDEHVLVLAPGYHPPELVKRFRKEGHILIIGEDTEETLQDIVPGIIAKNGEHISAYFEPFRVSSPLRGIGPADLHNRDPKDYPLVTTGAEVVGNGILAIADDGRTVICGMAPWQFPSDKQSFKRTFRRSAFTLSRLLGNMNVDMQTPLPGRFHGPVSENEKRWLDSLYLDQPEEWDDPYRFFRW